MKHAFTSHGIRHPIIPPSQYTSTSIALVSLSQELVLPFTSIIETFRSLKQTLSLDTPARQAFLKPGIMSGSELHGIGHWFRVAVLAVFILRHSQETTDTTTPFKEPFHTLTGLEVGALFAGALHDACRISDSPADVHGPRMTRFLQGLSPGQAHPLLVGETAEMVKMAVKVHTKNLPGSGEVGLITRCLCNADRLDRVRFSLRISPKYFFGLGNTRLMDELLGEDMQAPLVLLYRWGHDWAIKEFLSAR
eukprot:gnl/Dysnectes_brevis/6316_a9714_425.p1 GENE.gnl/Dysnectes_brevis/6316_a9714_425~~gnl/Dysnectes_brevis/6316_a9714_425.p1  ORF type:complete len:250 (+),score=6.63 gnl/Dysnectes_brevis/6316_a9714_425:110-859(+)